MAQKSTYQGQLTYRFPRVRETGGDYQVNTLIVGKENYSKVARNDSNGQVLIVYRR